MRNVSSPYSVAILSLMSLAIWTAVRNIASEIIECIAFSSIDARLVIDLPATFYVFFL